MVSPSLYEGFGLPVLEAVALGIPVITSNAASLPEVAGDAALLVDPYDVRAPAGAIAALGGDDAAVAQCGRAGLVQAERFSPEAYQNRLEAFHTTLGLPAHSAVTPQHPAPDQPRQTQ